MLVVDQDGAGLGDRPRRRAPRPPSPSSAVRRGRETRSPSRSRATRRAFGDDLGDAAVSIAFDHDQLGALEDLYSLLSHPVDDVGAGFAIANELKKAVADQHDHATTGGVEETTIFHCRLAAADDDHGLARLAVERLDQAHVVVDALEVEAGRERRCGRRQAQDEGARQNLPAGDLDRVRVDDSGRCIQHELDVELLLALIVHDGVRPSAATPEQVDHLLDRRRTTRPCSGTSTGHRRCGRASVPPHIPRRGGAGRRHCAGRSRRETASDR